jgi:hypothetical protein
MIDKIIKDTYLVRKNLGINKELTPPYNDTEFNNKILSIMNQLLKLQQDIKNDIGSRALVSIYTELLMQVLELKEIMEIVYVATDSVDVELKNKASYAFSNVFYNSGSIEPPSKYIV